MTGEYVYVTKSGNVYHTSKDCASIVDEPKRFRVEVAESWYRMCEECKRGRGEAYGRSWDAPNALTIRKRVREGDIEWGGDDV